MSEVDVDAAVREFGAEIAAGRTRGMTRAEKRAAVHEIARLTMLPKGSFDPPEVRDTASEEMRRSAREPRDRFGHPYGHHVSENQPTE